MTTGWFIKGIEGGNIRNFGLCPEGERELMKRRDFDQFCGTRTR